MFSHVILGLLRSGRQRHGYDLMVQYRRQSGNSTSPGNLYRELMRMTKAGLVEAGINPPDADPRRIPYHISERGRQAFDTWLLSLTRRPDDIENWLLFIDYAPRQTQREILGRYRDDLFIRSKLLARARDDALQALRTESDPENASFPLVLTRRLRQISAEIDFIDEVIQRFAEQDAGDGAAGEKAKPIESPARIPSRARQPRGRN